MELMRHEEGGSLRICLAYSVALLVVAQSLDFATTFIGITFFGVEAEANRFLRALLVPYGMGAISYHALGVVASSLVPFGVSAIFIQRSMLPTTRKQMWIIVFGLLFSLPPMIAGYSNLVLIWIVADLSAFSKIALGLYFGIVSLAWMFILVRTLTRRDILLMLLAGWSHLVSPVNKFMLKVKIYFLSRKMGFLSYDSRKILLGFLNRKKEQGANSVETLLNSLLGPCGILLGRGTPEKKRRSAALEAT
jgi:hypothetical protein